LCKRFESITLLLDDLDALQSLLKLFLDSDQLVSCGKSLLFSGLADFLFALEDFLGRSSRNLRRLEFFL
jgi:hypothetical protein